MPQSEISDLIIELRSATAGVASYGALRPYGRADRPAGRRCDEREGEGGLSSPEMQNGVRWGLGRRFCGTRVRRGGENGRSAAKHPYLASPKMQQTRLFAASSGRCPHPPASGCAAASLPIRLTSAARRASYRTLHGTVTRLTNHRISGFCTLIARNKKAGSRRSG